MIGQTKNPKNSTDFIVWFFLLYDEIVATILEEAVFKIQVYCRKAYKEVLTHFPLKGPSMVEK